MTIAERIIQLRRIKGYSTNKLSQLAEIAQATLREIEIGKKSPKITTLEKICKALEISLADFFNSTADDVPANQRKEPDDLPEHIQKEIDLITEFVLYRHGIKRPPQDTQ
ncbi:helix-turn-helix transcriptional regulator|uniref:DNA-binding transcriptional regulator, XRE family n=1 Tax=Dendrosporobacter quercicolus TaxID=146817 RepID=A0A1G9SJ84_9FIRM|nr:helix-turn-helix transcriptional regulator [Dendrosporobacter quercicolus]NSL48703.1 helix-turn-helix transcriptional regulator [Dendrosporobacter quercicolus DSM 1736]SDM35360.1 DNA-binding transcriptional regulator, XRE family [Dendrosporobacter quercicolus]